MKKRRTIAVVVACAAIVLCGVALKNWRQIAYRRPAPSDMIRTLRGESALDSLYLETYKKRATWLPGYEYWIPDQVCRFCQPEYARVVEKARLDSGNKPSSFPPNCTRVMS